MDEGRPTDDSDTPELDDLLAGVEVPPPPADLPERILAAGEDRLGALAAGIPGGEEAMSASTLSRMVSLRRLLPPVLLVVGLWGFLVIRDGREAYSELTITPSGPNPEIELRRDFRRALKIGQEKREAGDKEAAREHLLRAREIFRSGDLPPRPAWDLDSALLDLEIGALDWRSRAADERRIVYFEEVLEHLETQPETPYRKLRRINVLCRMAESQANVGRISRTRELARRILQLSRKLEPFYVGDYFNSPTWGVHRIVSTLEQTKPHQADLHLEALAIGLEISGKGAPANLALNDRTWFLRSQARYQVMTGGVEDARTTYRQLLEILREQLDGVREQGRSFGDNSVQSLEWSIQDIEKTLAGL